MARPLIYLVLALVAALALWSYARTHGAGADAATGSVASSTGGRGTPASTGPSTPIGAATGDAAPDRRPLAATDPTSESTAIPAAEAIEVEVLRADTGAPVAGATVLFAGSDYRSRLTAADREAYQQGRLPIDACLRKVGEVTTTDGRGIARVRRAPNFVAIAAIHDGYFGRFDLSTDRPRDEIERKVYLHRDYTLEITVVDADGAPAGGVPLELFGAFASATGGEDSSRRSRLGRTGKDDGVLLRHHAQLAGGANGRFSFQAAKRAWLTTNLPGTHHLTTPVAFGAATRIPVRVVLPAAGAIRVAVQDGSGQPLTGVRYVTLRDLAKGVDSADVGPDGIACFERVGIGRRFRIEGMVEGLRQKAEFDGPTRPGQTVETPLRFPVLGTVLVRVASPLGSFGNRGRPSLTIRRADGKYLCNRLIEPDGTCELKHVPVGERWKVECTLFHQKVTKEFPGPRTAGERVEVGIGPAAGATILTGRAIDGQGQPLPEESLRLEFRCGGQDVSLDAATNEQGRFAAGIPDRYFGKPITTFDLRTPATAEHPGRLGRIRYDRLLQPGTQDVGDVHLPITPLVVGGRVVGLERQPYFGEQIELGVEGRYPDPKAGGQFVWRPEKLHLRWLEGTRFELRGHPQADRLRLVLTCTRALPCTPLEFAAGTADLVVHARKGGVLRPRVITSHEISANQLSLLLTPTAGEMPPDQLGKALVGEVEWREDHDRVGTIFHWKNLFPGDYELEVRAAGVGRLAHFDAIRIEAGAVNRDPRLQPIDLRKTLQGVQLTVLDPDGKVPEQVRQGIVIVGDRTAAGDLEGYVLDHRGQCRLLTDKLPVQASVRVPGYRVADLYGLREDTTVRLQPILEVRLDWPPGSRPELPADHRLFVMLVHREALSGAGVDPGAIPVQRFHYQGGRRSGNILLRASKPVAMQAVGATVQVWEPGPYVPHLWLQKDGSKVVHRLGTLPPIEVRAAAAAPQAFPLAITQAAIDEAVGR